MTGNPRVLDTYEPHISCSSVTLADGSECSVRGSGTVRLSSSISLPSVLNLPGFSFNLMSISKVTRALNCCVSFYPDHCLFQDLLTKRIIGKGHESGGLYVMNTEKPTPPVACSASSTLLEVHCRSGHPSLPTLKKLYPQFEKVQSFDCEACRFAKHHRLPSTPRVKKRVNSPFELVHSDVWGPSPVVSKTGVQYFVSFVDDFSRTTWLYFMKNRSELFSHFTAFCAEIQTQFGTNVRILRSDNAKEYFSEPFTTYMTQNGILLESSCVDTPSQNGIAERKNRHLLETARALLFQTHVPKCFWADAVSTACFLINRMPSSVLQGDIPYQVLFPTKPLFPVAPRIFGSTCFVRDVRPNRTKLDPKSVKCVFMGILGYRKDIVVTVLISTDILSPLMSPLWSAAHSSFRQLLLYVRGRPMTC